MIWYWMCFYKSIWIDCEFSTWTQHLNLSKEALFLCLGLTSTTSVLNFCMQKKNILLWNRNPQENECNNKKMQNEELYIEKESPKKYAKKSFQEAHSQQSRYECVCLESQRCACEEWTDVVMCRGNKAKENMPHLWGVLIITRACNAVY